MSDDDLKELAMTTEYVAGGAGFNRERFIDWILEGHKTPSTANISNLSSHSASHSAPSSSERPKRDPRVNEQLLAEARAARNKRNAQRAELGRRLEKENSQRRARSATAEVLEIMALKNNSNHSEEYDNNYEKLVFLEDEIGHPEPSDYNICTEGQLFGLSENIENGDDRVLGYLYDISEGDEASVAGKSIVNDLLDRFTNEVIDDVKEASLSDTSVQSVLSKESNPSDILSEYSITNVLHLLSQALASVEEVEGQTDEIEPAAASASAAAARPARERRAPQRYIDIVTQVLRTERVRPRPRPKPLAVLNSNSGSAEVAGSQNSQVTCVRAALRETTKIRIEKNPAPSQAKKIHGIHSKHVNGDSLCSLCGFTLKERQPPDATILKWSYEHTIPVNLVALYFRIICSNNKYSAAEVEIMSQLGDVSCWNCNYTKKQDRFISIPKGGGGARPNSDEIGAFLENILISERDDGLTVDKKSRTIKIAIQNIQMVGDYKDKELRWKTIQKQNILKKVQNICNLFNTYVNIDSANERLADMKKYIRQCQAVANRHDRLKSTAFKQILASLSRDFPWKEDVKKKLSADRQSIKTRTYNFPFDTQKPEFYQRFDTITSGSKRGLFTISELSEPSPSPSKRPAPSNNTRRRRLRRSKQRKSRKIKRHTRRRT